MAMDDSIEVKTWALLAARNQWMTEKDDLQSALNNSKWAPNDIVLAPGMPDAVQEMIITIRQASFDFVKTLQKGADTCQRAADTVGMAAGMYIANEERQVERSKGIGREEFPG